MRIEIRPIETKRWHGKEKQENFTRPKKLTALVDGENMVYATGLSIEEEKEYSDILQADLSNQYNPNSPHPFWDSNRAVIKLDNSTMFLNTKIPIQFIKYKVAKASKYIANSVKDYEQGLYPEATHVIYDDKKETEIKASKVLKKNEVTKLSGELSKDRKIEIILILEGKNLKGQSDDYVLVKMAELIEDKPDEVLRYIKTEDRTLIANLALVKECLMKNVLKKVGHKIYYHESKLGDEDLTVAEYLSKDENQELKIRLKAQVDK